MSRVESWLKIISRSPSKIAAGRGWIFTDSTRNPGNSLCRRGAPLRIAGSCAVERNTKRTISWPLAEAVISTCLSSPRRLTIE